MFQNGRSALEMAEVPRCGMASNVGFLTAMRVQGMAGNPLRASAEAAGTAGFRL